MYMSIYQLSIEEFYELNVANVQSVMAEYKFRKVCQCMRWPGQSKVLTVESDDDGEEMLLTQGKSGI